MQNLFHPAKVAKLVAACLLGLFANMAVAGPVSINFEEMSPGLYASNYFTQGIVFSPSCHFDIVPAMSNWIGFDASGCFDPGPNKNSDYLGPAVGSLARLYVAPSAGDVLNLKSFKFMSVDPMSGGFSIHSSAGGVVVVDWTEGMGALHTFTGPNWVNLDWIVFSNFAGEPSGFDDLELQVHHIDEPSSVAILGLCLTALTVALIRGRIPISPPRVRIA